ncbi:MAG: four helix bundle protein, partial [Anaerolineae bacterium]
RGRLERKTARQSGHPPHTTSPVRKSSKSVMANIAEGYGRYHYLDKLRFVYVVVGEEAVGE